MIRQQLTQKQQQKLSPLQIQQVKLLELTGIEIEERINQELEENPALEEMTESPSETGEDGIAEDFESDEGDISQEDLSLGDYRTEEDIPDYNLPQNYYSEKNVREDIPYSENESFQEYLLEQFHLKNLPDEQFRTIGEYLIGNIDEDGYIRRELDAISDDLAFQYGIEVSIIRIREVLSLIWEMDPPGIGATDLQQCLLVQLKRKEKTHARNNAIQILENYFDAVSKKQYEKILKNLNLNEEELKDSIKEITLLNPRPGNAWESNMETKMAQITPDFFVDVVNGELVFSMQEQNIPELRVNREYGEMFNEYSNPKKKQSSGQKEAVNFVKQKLDSAKWFIDAIKQRSITLRKTMSAIIEIQHDFFFSGEESDLKPMILKDVSELCGYDISTVSRVSNSKYVQTNFGVYSLKYFFSESMTNDEGEEISTREIKAILKKCIDDEDKSKPLTDDLLMKELKNKGYEVARRTISKYREQLNVPVARLRKEI
ncbi:MAG: RNA polymerase factor sigma-54 [Candidatus Symbiothrix sp.]|jgi:RNA polymerase sigma-54 factor|nr:RNA polymerase factor sigma-54 [Candidatus Symbiothrix sp.]